MITLTTRSMDMVIEEQIFFYNGNIASMHYYIFSLSILTVCLNGNVKKLTLNNHRKMIHIQMITEGNHVKCYNAGF